MMILSFLKTALRNFTRNGFYSAINVMGLSIGITCAILIFSILKFELSYDSQFDKENIYRVIREEFGYNELGRDPGVPHPFAAAFRQDFPEAKWVSIVDTNFRNPVFSVEGSNGPIKFFEEPVYVDPDFFKIFNLTWLYGNAETALPDNSSIVITESVAKKYFGTTDAVNKTIIENSETTLIITGVVRDFPENSSFNFNIFLPYARKFDEANSTWNSISSSTQCFFILEQGVNPEDLEYRLTDFYFKYAKKTDDNAQTRFLLQKLGDIHLNNDVGFTYTRVADLQSIYALGLIGAFIVLTASINFINLNTVQVAKRAREIGIRKVMGSRRSGLIAQFLSETFIITLLSVLLSFGLVELSLIHIDKLLGYSLEFGSWMQMDNILFVLILLFAVTLLSGWYPAMVLSGFQPALALKSKLTNTSKSSLGLRRILVILQFVISQVLIVCTIIVGRQMNYFNNANMGFEKDAVIEVRLYGHDQNSREAFKSGLLQESVISNVSYSNTSASSGNIWSGPFGYLKGEEEIREEAQVKWVDSDFINTYGLEIIAGEDLLPSDTTNRFLVNEEFLRAVEANSPDEVIGNYLSMWGEHAPITGVVKDFFSASMAEKMMPVVIGTRPQYSMAGIKIASGDIHEALNKIEAIYNDIFPQSIFEYDFLDERIAKYYEDEARDNILFSTFSIISIFIGGLGLLGLISYMAQQRVKEVGIRKVFGASIIHLMVLFTKEFVLLIFIAFILSAPVAYYVMHQWLADFPYRIEIDVWVFILSVAITFVIAFLSVGYKSYTAAITNPVDVLRDE